MTVNENTVSLEEIAGAQSQLRQLVTGFWGARAVQAALSLGVFTHLGEESMPASFLAQRLLADARATEMLLTSLVALGLLEKEGDRYRNSPVARLFMLTSSPYFQGAMVDVFAGDWTKWQDLETAIKQGTPSATTRGLGMDMVRASSNNASVLAPLLAKKLDLSRIQRVLEIGPGAGMYSIALARVRPDLTAVVLDGEPALTVAREHVSAAGLSERIRLQAGDYHQEDFGTSQYDMVLMSDLLHLHSPEQARALLQKAFGALTCEGQCVMNGFLMRDDRSGPAFSTLYALQMLLTTANGMGYSGWDVTDLMQNVGFIRLQIIPLEPSSNSLVVGSRP